MIAEEKRLKTKEQLKDWLSFELPRYCKKLGTIKYYLGFSESAVLYQHQKLLRKAEYYCNSGGGYSLQILLL